MMKTITRLCVNFALCLLVESSLAEGGACNISEVLGATHMNPLYNFTDAPVLEEGSDVLRHMGACTIKLWFGFNYKNKGLS